MAVTEKTKMVNGRVAERSVERAGRILADEGLTISAFIRNSLEYVAAEGVVPPSGFPLVQDGLDLKRVQAFAHSIEARKMPGKQDYPGLEGDALAERIRLERYGY